MSGIQLKVLNWQAMRKAVDRATGRAMICMPRFNLQLKVFKWKVMGRVHSRKPVLD